MELCELGSLFKYLRREQHEDPSTSADLDKWSLEIANGMKFLAEKKVVHADLATRNVLLTVDKIAKISDFGLSRKLYNYSPYVKQHRQALPWRWMAPESLCRMEFNDKSDVWAFGVTLWEIYSKGNTPYYADEWNVEFPERLLQGYCLKKPANCNNFMYSIMLKCWTADAAMRPTFAEMHEELTLLVHNVSCA